MPYPQFDRSRLRLLPISQRIHDVDISIMMNPDAVPESEHPSIADIAMRVRDAKENGASVLLMLGGHVIRAGAAPCLIRLMQEGYITHFALNGAAAIHDFELALIGATCESVGKYISEGQFGLWEEDALINQAVEEGIPEGMGFGEALGKFICDREFPHRETSLLAAAYQHGVPLTVHVGIGNDIVHEQPNANGAAIGEASYRDFLIYTQTVDNLEGGAFLNFGSAVTGPEVYLKALSMCRNVAHQEGRQIRKFTTAVFDIQPLSGDTTKEPVKANPHYYFRPWKTILARTVADGGESFYVEALHRDTVAALTHRLLKG